MEDSLQLRPRINKLYIFVVTVLTAVVPLTALLVEHVQTGEALTFGLFGKWFIFSAVGLRLFLAGVRQITKPAFTARDIFHIESVDSFPIIRELGFANLCFGIVGILSLFLPHWRVVSAFASGLYYGLAGLQHVVKKPAGANEWMALWSDLLIFALLLIYFIENTCR